MVLMAWMIANQDFFGLVWIRIRYEKQATQQTGEFQLEIKKMKNFISVT